MSSSIFSATELIAVITLYCVTFCPILCWVLGKKATPINLIPASLGKTSNSFVK